MADGKGKTIAYAILTGLICLSQTGSGVMDLIQHEELVKGVTSMGYPAWLLYILGPWKILGCIALAIPGMGRLKEWAYAGFFFDFTGGFASHLLAGQSFGEAMPALIATFILIGSYVLRPESRRI